MAFPTESRLYAYTVYHGVAWCGMAALAVVLLVICSLLSGLTLALCGLDTTWLKLRSITGTPRQKYGSSSSFICSVLTCPRQQALVVGKIKSHSTWMLCKIFTKSFKWQVANICRFLDSLLRCLWRILTFCYPKSLAWKPPVGSHPSVDILDRSICRNSPSVHYPSTCNFLGLLLLTCSMGLHVAHGHYQLPSCSAP